MKRTVITILITLLCLGLCACGTAAGSRARASSGVTVEELLAQAESSPTPEPTTTPEPALISAAETNPEDLSSADADVDLTLLGSTMVYSEVSRMMYEPEGYLGKIVKMHGSFNVYETEARNYYACLIQDATACCANGIEFELIGSPRYPEDYPEPGAEITVVGVFDLYEEDGYTYIQLSHAQLEA